MIEDVLEAICCRDMQIIESAYLLGASDREQMLGKSIAKYVNY
jgi:hypothetical protein